MSSNGATRRRSNSAPDRVGYAGWRGSNSGRSSRVMRFERLEKRFLLSIVPAGAEVNDQFLPIDPTLDLQSSYLQEEVGELALNPLVHHWNFDEGRDWHDDPFDAVVTDTVAADLVGGADATLTNMGAADWVSGRQFSGLEFDGVDDYLRASGDLCATLGDTSSLSFWINTTQTGGTTGANSPGITGVEQAADSNDIQWGWIDNTGRVNVSVGGAIAATSADPVNDGQWHHVVLTRDATTGAAEIYVDGWLSGSGSGATGARTTPFSSLGRIEDTGGSPEYFAGRLDQVHVFDQVIDAATVHTLKDNHAPKTCNGDSNIISPAIGTNITPFSTHSATKGFAYDVERDPLAVASFEQPANGTVTHNGDGSFTYTATGGFVGNDSFRVVVTDGNGGYSRTTLSVVVLDDAAAATTATATFTDFQNVQAAGANIEMIGWSTPRAVDFDANGTLDILVGGNNSVWLYSNSGTTTMPVFDAGLKLQAGGADINLSSTTVTIALADMTGDGVDDLVAVDSSRLVRVYRNTAAAGQAHVYAAATFVKTPGDANLVLQDQRFDVGDYNNDGLSDIIQGTRESGIWAYENGGTANDPRFDSSTQLFDGLYNLYPRVFDLNFDGRADLLRGINWGDVTYWINVGGQDILDGGASSRLSITYSDGVAVNMQAETDGAIVDLADYNGDKIPDLLIGAHLGGQVFIAYGKDASANIDAIEAIYDANLPDLGAALSANDNALLQQVNSLNREWINWAVTLANPTDRRAAFDRLVLHINTYPEFLKHRILDTTQYHHLASIAGQNWMTLHQLGPFTQAHLTEVADAMGLTGGHRDVYIESGLHMGDGAHASAGQLASLETFMQTQAGALFPDTMITIDDYWGDGRGGTVNVFTASKNVFGWEVGGPGSSPWAPDLEAAITSTLREDTLADPFTYVVGHEATHSLNDYVDTRANADLRRRWGQVMVLAGGPDIIAGADGRVDWAQTQQHWQDAGLWDPATQTWDAAYSAYWTTGPGSVWRYTSFMRGNIGGIDWFFDYPQESLATQANQHWADSEGRLIGAVDRFARGVCQGIDPLKANINEVVHFLDLQSAGLNKVNMFDIDTQSNPNLAVWNITEAYLERNDSGYITGITIEDREYAFAVDAGAIVTDVLKAPWFIDNGPPPPQLYFTLKYAGSVGSLEGVTDEDILGFDGTDFSLYFDGSDVGLGGEAVRAFALTDEDEILLSLKDSWSGYDDSDILKFTATSLGENTAGTFELYFDGSDVGLSTSHEDIDALELLEDGRIVVSTRESFSVPGVAGEDEDLIAFTPTSLGTTTAGTWELYFDGSELLLGESSGEDIDAVAVDSKGDVYLSTTGSFSVPVLSGKDEDIFVFQSSTGAYSPSLFFDGSAHGLGANDIYAFDISIEQGAAQAPLTRPLLEDPIERPSFPPAVSREALFDAVLATLRPEKGVRNVFDGGGRFSIRIVCSTGSAVCTGGSAARPNW